MTLVSHLSFASSICSGALAVGVSIQARRFVARWALAVGLAVLAVESACIGASENASSLEGLIYWQYWRIFAISLIPGVWLLFSLGYARGNAWEFFAKWRFPLAAAFLIPPAAPLFARHQLFVAVPPTIQGGQRLLHLGWSGIALNLLLLIVSVLVLMNLERTLRASVGTMRWRIKFMLLGVGVIFVARLYTSSQALLFRAIDLPLESINSGALLVACLLMLRSLFRTGHFDINVYPSDSVLQGSVAVLLAGIYLLSVGVFAKVVMYVGGDDAFALQAFLVLAALVGLTILFQSDRVRHHLWRFVSRHFQRPFYDYRTVWKRFSEGTASQIDRDDLSRTLVRLVAEIFQALSVAIWLVDEKQESFTLVASTSTYGTPGHNLRLSGAGFTDVFRYFQTHPGPVDVESRSETWASSLRALHPSEFPEGGNRVCVPIIGRGEVLGLLFLGDRVAGALFSVQDIDMLKCVGDHAAAGLLNVQLSQRLVQAKELEAFQTMAAFFVHDLKNAASTLNLMLQNLPIHFDDPAFREDALRGISKSVTHINHMVGRLSLLRHEFKIQPSECDLNSLIIETLKDLDLGGQFVLNKKLGFMRPIRVDREQIAKVVTNLVINARESLAGTGKISLETSQTNDWAVLTVADNGSGMTAEFIDRSLFRPFQTTKKNGLGIGMFQSKMIVESHGGRITVASEPSQGTTIQVFLPMPKPSS